MTDSPEPSAESSVEPVTASSPGDAPQEAERPADTGGPALATDTGDSTDVSLASVVEAVLFASDEPVPASKLACLIQQTPKQVRQLIDQLNDDYQRQGHAFRIEKIAGGWQMLTLPCYMPWLRQLVRVREDSKLSPAALETLAIIAYKQPVIRADLEAIRGVACGEVLRSLMSKGLVKMVGRAEVVGRPMQYGTTKKFLQVFGLDSLKDLPTIDELRPPRTESIRSQAPDTESGETSEPAEREASSDHAETAD